MSNHKCPFNTEITFPLHHDGIEPDNNIVFFNVYFVTDIRLYPNKPILYCQHHFVYNLYIPACYFSGLCEKDTCEATLNTYKLDPKLLKGFSINFLKTSSQLNIFLIYI